MVDPIFDYQVNCIRFNVLQLKINMKFPVSADSDWRQHCWKKLPPAILLWWQIRGSVRPDSRGRLLRKAGQRQRWGQGEASTLGHCWSREVQVDNQVVLPQLGGRRLGLRHLQHGELQAHPGLADGGEEAHRASPGHLPHGWMQERSCQDREGGAERDSAGTIAYFKQHRGQRKYICF